MVEITGGEPLRQAGVSPLMQALLDSGRTVLLETNGSLPLCSACRTRSTSSWMSSARIPAWPPTTWRRTSTCCGSEGRVAARDEIKFVLSSPEDFHWARAMVAEQELTRITPVLFSPVRPLLDPAILARLLLDHRLDVRLQLQLHTLLWPDQTRGV